MCVCVEKVLALSYTGARAGLGGNYRDYVKTCEPDTRGQGLVRPQYRTALQAMRNASGLVLGTDHQLLLGHRRWCGSKTAVRD